MDILSQRQQYDMTHWVFGCHGMGQLQTLSLIPVVAGDSWDINAKIVYRLSPLRRQMYMDVIVETFGFFVPHRHIYGSDWTDFIKNGVNETTTFGTRTMTGDIECMASHLKAGVVPKWIPEGYLKIWNRYFKNPTEADVGMDYLDAFATGSNTLLYGMPCGHTPRVWNTPVEALATATDRRIALVDTDKIDLVTFAQKQGTFRTVRGREFFANSNRYTDVLDWTFGTNVNTDADQRAELLFHNREWLSAYDVDGTASDSLGYYTSKSVSLSNVQMPTKFFPEHGAIWIMSLLRFPCVHADERHLLAGKTNPTYAQISGDPSVYATQPPEVLNPSEYITSATDTDAGLIPYGQWYREQPHHVHGQFKQVTGHPFLTAVIDADNDLNYIAVDDYDPVFVNIQMKHAQSQGQIIATVKRVVPQPTTSIFAGART